MGQRTHDTQSADPYIAYACDGAWSGTLLHIVPAFPARVAKSHTAAHMVTVHAHAESCTTNLEHEGTDAFRAIAVPAGTAARYP
eukprot:54228-Eustigmatos_ZCMA.PRE.1